VVPLSRKVVVVLVVFRIFFPKPRSRVLIANLLDAAYELLPIFLWFGRRLGNFSKSQIC
jgi:hypothetical protein